MEARRRDAEEGKVRLDARLGPEAGEPAWRYEGRLAGCQQHDSKQLDRMVVDI